MKNQLDLLNISDEDFISKIIVPGHFQIASNNSSRFGIRDTEERIIICSNDYANEIGYQNFKDAMFKRPDHDYERSLGSVEHFEIQMNYLNANKKSFHYTYKDKKTSALYMTITEPLFNFQGKVIGKKETDVPLQLVSHRHLVEKHFKKYDINVVALENITGQISLNEKEEIVLFMLIGGYSQLEIGDLLGVSRSYVLKIISENLCVKFGLTIASTKLLIEKAIMLGFANFIPSKFLSTLNAK